MQRYIPPSSPSPTPPLPHRQIGLKWAPDLLLPVQRCVATRPSAVPPPSLKHEPAAATGRSCSAPLLHWSCPAAAHTSAAAACLPTCITLSQRSFCPHADAYSGFSYRACVVGGGWGSAAMSCWQHCRQRRTHNRITVYHNKRITVYWLGLYHPRSRSRTTTLQVVACEQQVNKYTSATAIATATATASETATAWRTY